MTDKSDIDRLAEDYARKSFVYEVLCMNEAERKVQLMSGWIQVFPFVWRYRDAVADQSVLGSNVVRFKWKYSGWKVALRCPQDSPARKDNSR